MENIHVLKTDKPSRLWINNLLQGKLELSKDVLIGSNTSQNIYITSDEEIKEGDWCLDIKRNIIFQSKRSEIGTSKKIPIIICTYEGCYIQKDCKKIILTTDGDLIKDDVQAIDDEFLEWFVKNPSYEEVNVEIDYSKSVMNYSYKIIIPKEELKQTDENGKPLTYWGGLAEPKQITSLDGDGLGGIPKGILTMLIGEKEETLKEAAEKYVNINVAKNAAKLMYKEHFIAGAKWQQQRSYSGEEAFNLLMEFSSRDRNSSSGTPHSIAKWFEQFKKK